METISFFDIWPPRNSIVLNMSDIILPNFAYLQKALPFGSFSSSYPRDQDHFLLGHFVVKGLQFNGNNFIF